MMMLLTKEKRGPYGMLVKYDTSRTRSVAISRPFLDQALEEDATMASSRNT